MVGLSCRLSFWSGSVWAPASARSTTSPSATSDRPRPAARAVSLNAVQQLANAIGAAAVTTVYFKAVGGGATHALLVSLAVVGAAVALCLCLVRLPAAHGAGGPWSLTADPCTRTLVAFARPDGSGKRARTGVGREPQ
ncbi:hypothetical protein ACRAWF_38645 [Streptomyces sp. L7]